MLSMDVLPCLHTLVCSSLDGVTIIALEVVQLVTWVPSFLVCSGMLLKVICPMLVFVLLSRTSVSNGASVPLDAGAQWAAHISIVGQVCVDGFSTCCGSFPLASNLHRQGLPSIRCGFSFHAQPCGPL